MMRSCEAQSKDRLSGMIIKARVVRGRLVVDEPTDLPEGTELDLLPLDPVDWLDETERAALHQALRESEADILAGRVVNGEEILEQLKARESRPCRLGPASADV